MRPATTNEADSSTVITGRRMKGSEKFTTAPSGRPCRRPRASPLPSVLPGARLAQGRRGCRAAGSARPRRPRARPARRPSTTAMPASRYVDLDGARGHLAVVAHHVDEAALRPRLHGLHGHHRGLLDRARRHRHVHEHARPQAARAVVELAPSRGSCPVAVSTALSRKSTRPLRTCRAAVGRGLRGDGARARARAAGPGTPSREA